MSHKLNKHGASSKLSHYTTPFYHSLKFLSIYSQEYDYIVIYDTGEQYKMSQANAHRLSIH